MLGGAIGVHVCVHSSVHIMYCTQSFAGKRVSRQQCGKAHKSLIKTSRLDPKLGGHWSGATVGLTWGLGGVAYEVLLSVCVLILLDGLL